MKDSIMFIKMPDKDFNDSDEYGYKELFGNVIKEYCCPDCKKAGSKSLSFLEWEDEAKGLAVCPHCGFKKQFALNANQEKSIQKS